MRLTMRAVSTALLLLSPVGLISCDNDENGDVLPDVNLDGTATNFGALSEAQAVRVLQLANEGEIAAGQLAQQRATRQEVRDYAGRMVTEHTAVNQRLTALAQQLGINPEDSDLSRNLEEDNALILQALQRLSGERFDTAYMDSQVAAHGKTLFIIDGMANEIQRAELVTEFGNLRTAIQGHLSDAAPLQETVSQQQ